MILPSKELLNEVLDKEVKNIKIVNNSIYVNSVSALEANVCTAFGNYEDSYNVNVVAHLCLEWAFDQGESLHTWKSMSNKWICTFRYDIDGSYEQIFDAPTMHEVIFKACLYIKNEKEMNEH